MNKGGGVIVAHPGTQHSFETAAGLYEAGLLHRYITGFRYRDDGFLARFLRFVPGRLAGRLDRSFEGGRAQIWTGGRYPSVKRRISFIPGLEE